MRGVLLFHPLSDVSVNGCPLGNPSDVCRGKGAYWTPHSKRVGPKTTARNVSFPCRFHPKFGYALNASPLRFMVMESWLTHMFAGCIASMNNGCFIVTPFYGVLYCVLSEGADIYNVLRLYTGAVCGLNKNRWLLEAQGV